MPDLEGRRDDGDCGAVCCHLDDARFHAAIATKLSDAKCAWNVAPSDTSDNSSNGRGRDVISPGEHLRSDAFAVVDPNLFDGIDVELRSSPTTAIHG
jgi:hypothetical protein